MNKDEESGFLSLVVIALCGFALLAALTAPIWVGPAQNWLVPPQNWLPDATSVDKGGTEAPQAPATAWTDEEIQTALMQCVQALAPITTDVATVNRKR